MMRGTSQMIRVLKIDQNAILSSVAFNVLGKLSLEQRISFIDAMEKDILIHKDFYPDEYFRILKNFFWQDQQCHSTSYAAYQETLNQINRLEWLYRKNVDLSYRTKIVDLEKKLMETLSEEQRKQYNEIADLEIQRQIMIDTRLGVNSDEC